MQLWHLLWHGRTFQINMLLRTTFRRRPPACGVARVIAVFRGGHEASIGHEFNLAPVVPQPAHGGQHASSCQMVGVGNVYDDVFGSTQLNTAKKLPHTNAQISNRMSTLLTHSQEQELMLFSFFLSSHTFCLHSSLISFSFPFCSFGIAAIISTDK